MLYSDGVGAIPVIYLNEGWRSRALCLFIADIKEISFAKNFFVREYLRTKFVRLHVYKTIYVQKANNGNSA